jgi:hypothetical protein
MVLSLPISHHAHHPSPSLPTPAPNGQGGSSPVLFFLKKENIIPAATMTSNLIRLRERDRASSEAENLPPPQPADGHHCAAFPHAGRPHHHRVHGPARHWCRCANAGIQLDLPTSGRLGLQVLSVMRRPALFPLVA